MLFRKSFAICAAIIFLFGAAISVSYAKYVPKIEVQTTGNGTAYLVVNQIKAIDFLVSNGSMKPVERANVAADRLRSFAAKGLSLDYLGYKQTDNDARLLIDDQLLIIATRADARAHKVSPAELASTWIRNLKQALSVPPLSASPTSLLIPLGESRLMKINSLLTDPVEAEISNADVISVDPNSTPGSLVVNGKSLGNATITLKCAEYSVPISVTVKKYAAYFNPQQVTAIVTGCNAPASLVGRTARDAARRSINVGDGAAISTVQTLSNVTDLAPGKSTIVNIRIAATGSDYIPAQFDLPIKVENHILPVKEPSWIMYSNDPEQIKKYQTLFIGRLDTLEEGYRLLYHHQNMMGSQVGLVMEMLNSSDKPATMHLIEGISDPILDTITVGYKAGLEFMDNRRKMVGRIIEIPAQCRWVVLSQSVPATNTASGLVEMRQLSGDPLYIRIIAKPDFMRLAEDTPGIALAMNGINTESLRLSDHLYPEPEMRIDTVYKIGGAWNFVRIGKNAIKHATQDKLLYGNYGVTYHINAKLENPSDTPQKIEVAYEATAGPSSGIFYIDGQIYTIKLLKPPLDKTIVTVTVPARQTKALSIQTMPLSGSAYPSTLIIRPAGTMASASNL